MSDEKTRFHNPFAALGEWRGRLPAGPVPAPPEPKPAETDLRGRSSAAKTCARAVVRMERSGRGGKDATVIEQLDLAPAEREAWLKALKAALGCGGKIEGDTIMLQGDQRERLKKILAERGVKRVTIG
jgi:translation initiation factor 1